MLKMCESYGMDMKAIDMIGCQNQEMEDLIKKNKFRTIQFTGSSKVANHLVNITNGKCKIEDAGFDWKIFGPDVINTTYASYQSD